MPKPRKKSEETEMQSDDDDAAKTSTRDIPLSKSMGDDGDHGPNPDAESTTCAALDVRTVSVATCVPWAASSALRRPVAEERNISVWGRLTYIFM